MLRWFLSYHSPDQVLAERLKVAIERKEPDSRVFFAPTNLRAGGSWSAQLAQEIADASAFVLLIGPAGIGKWQVPEYDEALDRWVKSDRKFPLIVVLLEGQTAPGLAFLRQLHWIVTADPTSERDIARLFDAVSGDAINPGELWRYTSPYRGLEAMEEKDSDYFFGRQRETVEVLSALTNAPDRLPVLIGNSGVGKSSLAQAGVLAALKRQAWPEDAQVPNAWPVAFQDSRKWCFLSLKPGTEPLKALVESFLDTWQFAATDVERISKQNDLVDLLLGGRASLSDLIDATERRRKELDQPKPPGFFLYVDQGEELYVRAEPRQRVRFSELLVKALADPHLRVIMSMRSDFLGHLQNDEALFKARQQIDVPPLREAALREIVSSPARLLSARFETDGLIDIISRRTAEDSVKDVGALPLLSYTLDDMWTSMVRRGDGTLRLPAQSFELGGVLADRANRFLKTHPGAEDRLRRVLTLRLATVREDAEPTRRRAARAEFTDEEWRLVGDLADYPNRLVVTVTTDTGDTFAEVAHEAIFRRWDKLREWIAAEREFLAWRSVLEAARRAWEVAPERSKRDALLMGLALAHAKSWLAKRGEDLSAADREFAAQSAMAEGRQRHRTQALVGAVAVAIVASLAGWVEHDEIHNGINNVWRYVTVTRPFAAENIWPYVLTADAERALRPDASKSFGECTRGQGKDYCPEMIVVPAGSFIMGQQMPQQMREMMGKLFVPPHLVTIAKPFAVSKYEVTFDEWDTCVDYGDCTSRPPDLGLGRGQNPVIELSWDDAQQYVAWLSKITGKPYRLLSEAEYEYAARAGMEQSDKWINDIGKNVESDLAHQMAQLEAQLAPSPNPNPFGLYVTLNQSWTLDCYHENYQGAPTDGSAWIKDGDCSSRIVYGGSWGNSWVFTRAARLTGDRVTGIRIARTLDVPALTERQIDQIKQQRQSDLCTNKNDAYSSDLQIAGCTALIQSARLNGDELTRAYGGRASGYYHEGDYGRSIADYTEAIRLDPSNPHYLNSRCRERSLAGGDLQAALADCNEALRLRPDDANILNSRGLVQLKLGAYDRAIADYSRAIAKNVKDADSLYGRGVAKLKSGDTNGGNADITAAKAIKPDISEVYASYGVT